MQFNKYTHTHTHTHTVSLIPPREDQCEWHRMTRMTGPDCVVMCNLINTHTHTHTHTQDQREWHRMTRMTRPDCAVMCNLINIHTHTHTHTSIGARSPLPTPSFLSLCRYVVSLAQTCMPSSRSSPSDGYSIIGRRHISTNPNIWRKGQK